jgi:uncharacterized coiled-coil DUF342 family protein
MPRKGSSFYPKDRRSEQIIDLKKQIASLCRREMELRQRIPLLAQSKQSQSSELANTLKRLDELRAELERVEAEP